MIFIFVFIVLGTILIYIFFKTLIEITSYDTSYEKEQMDYAMWKKYSKKGKK
jgi:regulatory protein YycI of two-component signal transduction system YycFG